MHSIDPIGFIESPYKEKFAVPRQPRLVPAATARVKLVGSVFATRSTFRPNGIGMSAVEIKGISKQGDQVYLDLGSVDLVDGTPIIDIKPYIPYSDSIPDAIGGYAESEPERSPVIFSSEADALLATRPNGPLEKQVIEQVLAQDPRPAYKKNKPDEKEYAVNLFDLNIKFVIQDKIVTVSRIERF